LEAEMEEMEMTETAVTAMIEMAAAVTETMIE
jgi:hypothetical protein